MSSKRSSSTPSSAAIIEGSNDLLIEILFLLPASSLFKFKLVSRRWRSLISDPWFRRLRRLPKTQPLFILGDRLNSVYYVCNPTDPAFFPLPLCSELQSCNGLLLLRCIKRGRNRYYVFNPTTLQRRDLSPLPFNSSVAGIYLMFDPSLSPYYRVVCFVRAKDCTLVYLYNSETHQWRRRRETLTRKMQYHDGIYFNGGICFLRSGSASYRFTPDDNLSEFPSHPLLLLGYCSFESIYGNCITLRSNGALLVCSTMCADLLDVYEMKEKENGWTCKYRIDFRPIWGISNSLHVLDVIEGETLEDASLLFIMAGKVMIYWFCDFVFQELLDLERNGYGSGNGDAQLFLSTLAPV